MTVADEDALVCDFAQFYGIYDWRRLPLTLAATLAQGLPGSSRTARALSGQSAESEETALLAVIADRLGHIAWMFSEDGRLGKNHPPSIFAAITGGEKRQSAGYESGEDFAAAWAAITGGDNDG